MKNPISTSPRSSGGMKRRTKPVKNESFECSECRTEVASSYEFCPRCGTLFLDHASCHNHHTRHAEGACVICCLPYCRECGRRVNNHFLCNDHQDYEIYQGMVRIHGTLDDIAAQYAKSCLEQAGFHPYLFCRVQPRGGPRFVYTLFRAAGEYDGHLINEIKVMVPLQEAVAAERLLKKLLIVTPAGSKS